jgi:predicted short-subunit dehydrogenase-like oxidoreductase (DUF2520 family)
LFLEKEIKNIVIIGSGNVSYHLVNAFSRIGVNVLQILARNENTAKNLSETFKIPYIIQASKLNKEADLYILSVNDDNIRSSAMGLGLDNQILVHTSGFAPIGILEGASAFTGVIWPLQTLTSGIEVDYSHMPFFIEGKTNEVTEKLTHLVRQVSDKVLVTDSPTRQKIHLAAVIASNFANHLYAISASILDKYDIPFDVLAPLIIETANKAGRQHPMSSQTGPAVRNDLHVIAKHLEMLGDDPASRAIYRMITENIIHHHSKKK